MAALPSQPVLVLSLALALGSVATVAIAGAMSVGGRRTRVLRFSAVLVVFMGIGCAIIVNGLRFNFTPSMPLGVYRFTPVPQNAIHRGMLVAVCLPLNVAEFGRRRGYLSSGVCAAATELLLKAVVAVAGDDVVISPKGVSVNGRLLPNSRPVAFDRSGRRLVPLRPGDYRLRHDQIWLYADHERSWDSRYWGPVPIENIVARVTPQLTLPP